MARTAIWVFQLPKVFWGTTLVSQTSRRAKIFFLSEFGLRQSVRDVSAQVKSKRVLTLGLCLTVVVVAGVYAMRAVIERVEENALAPYRAKTAGDLVVRYLKTHNNEWPSGWEELTEDAIGSDEDAKWIAGVREHVDVDFDFQLKVVDLSQELDLSRPPFRAVWLKNDFEISPEGPEANMVIFHYLKRSSQLATSRGEQ